MGTDDSGPLSCTGRQGQMWVFGAENEMDSKGRMEAVAQESVGREAVL